MYANILHFVSVLDSSPWSSNNKSVLFSRDAVTLFITLTLLGACSSNHPAEGLSDSRPESILDLPAPDGISPDAPLPRPDGGSNTGAPCSSDHHCSTGLSCNRTMPGGFCTHPCSADKDCPAGSGCQAQQCHPLCKVRALMNPCRKQYVCSILQTRALCIAGCDVAGCSAGWTCDAATRLCLNPKGGTWGAECSKSAGDCSGTPNGVCYSVSTYLKAFCTVPCAPFTKPCPAQPAGAYCPASASSGEYCMFFCDPKKPKCPRPDMECKDMGYTGICLPK